MTCILSLSLSGIMSCIINVLSTGAVYPAFEFCLQLQFCSYDFYLFYFMYFILFISTYIIIMYTCYLLPPPGMLAYVMLSCHPSYM